MVVRSKTSRPFIPGTTGWTVEDLNDHEIEAQWERGRYEIVEGVLTKMPPAYYDGSIPIQKLLFWITKFLEESKQKGHVGREVDLILQKKRVVIVDAVYMTPEDERRQREANAERGRKKVTYGRLLVPPTLVIESISIGHEEHDEETKRTWYAEFSIPNYWLLNPYERTLQCLVLEHQNYVVDQGGKHKDVLRPRLFPGMIIELADLWLD